MFGIGMLAFLIRFKAKKTFEAKTDGSIKISHSNVRFLP